ncbi:MAG: hypothetical protein GY696_02120 [Gammaproteobacteria bacterium]|nr:hypothetical protein [Gammaproteobacteria bacterium]
MLEVFLKAMAPVVRKLIIDKVKDFCMGCIENRPGPHAHLCQQTYYREVVKRMRRHLTGFLPDMHAQVFTEMRKVVSEDVKFHHLSLADFLGFFGDPSNHYPLQRLFWDPDWWFLLEEELVVLEEKHRIQEKQRTRETCRRLIFG